MNVKKVFAMSSKSHRDDLKKSSRRFLKVFAKTFLFHREDFFNI
jgi:hypothetical protein